MTTIVHFLFSLRWWSVLANIVLSAFIGHQTVTLLLAFKHRAAVPAMVMPTSETSSEIKSNPLVDLSPLLNIPLFGSTNRPTAEQTVPVADPPKTKLDLSLQGIYHSTDPLASYALISDAQGGSILCDSRHDQSNKTPLCTIGKNVLPEVVLHQIFPKHIILYRNGRYETLHLIDNRASTGQSASEESENNKLLTATVENHTNDYQNLSSGQLLGHYQQQLRENPETLLSIMDISPMVEKGNFLGFRLNPGKNPQLMDKFNLRPGDILKSVNNLPLESPMQGFNVLQQLATATRLDLEILRDGQTIPLSFSIE